MPQVTRIKPQKNKNRVNIYLDGQYAFPLDIDNLIKFNLKVGQNLSNKEINELIFKNEFQKLYERCLRLISARPRSEKEIIDYLQKNLPKQDTIVYQIGRNLVEGVLGKLKKLKLIDDQAFTVWWVEQRNVFRPRGKKLLLFELRQKGIKPEIAREIVEKEVDELKLAKRLLKKRLKKVSDRELVKDPKIYQKNMAYLSRQGFSWEIIKEVLDEKFKKV